MAVDQINMLVSNIRVNVTAETTRIMEDVGQQQIQSAGIFVQATPTNTAVVLGE